MAMVKQMVEKKVRLMNQGNHGITGYLWRTILNEGTIDVIAFFLHSRHLPNLYDASIIFAPLWKSMDQQIVLVVFQEFLQTGTSYADELEFCFSARARRHTALNDVLLATSCGLSSDLWFDLHEEDDADKNTVWQHR